MSGRGARLGSYSAFFFATAGSAIDVTLERVDTSKPWEHPDSLDPQIEIVAPDGFLYQNLVALDNQPSVDLNASLHGAVVPLSGMYVLYAETTRGFGDYRLHFAVTAMAPATERVFALADSFTTVPAGETTHPVAIVLDPRDRYLYQQSRGFSGSLFGVAWGRAESQAQAVSLTLGDRQLRRAFALVRGVRR